MFVPLVLPTKRDYYMDKLAEDNMDEYYAVNSILDYLDVEEGGARGHVFKHARRLIDAGWIEPVVVDDPTDDSIHLQFLLWSFIDGKYKNVYHMDRGEYSMFEYFLERMFDAN